MARYEVTSDRLPHPRGEVVDLDPDAVNIPALIAAGHVKPKTTKGARGGDARTR